LSYQRERYFCGYDERDGESVVDKAILRDEEVLRQREGNGVMIWESKTEEVDACGRRKGETLDERLQLNWK
jgi:hypothetical protein